MTRRKWTEADDALLSQFWHEGKDDPTIAYILGRHRELVWKHRNRLGLAPNTKGGLPKGHHTHTPEAKAKSGEASRRRWQDPEYRARMLPAVSKATAASAAARVKSPRRGTPEFKLYRKVRENLGPAAAHKLLVASAARAAMGDAR